MLSDPGYLVPSAAPAAGGVAWLRGAVARFSNGADHERRRALVVSELAAVEPESLRELAVRRGTGVVEVLAEALGLPPSVAGDVAVIAKSYQPHTVITPAADQAVERLVQLIGPADELTANRISLLVQACDATEALVANTLAGYTGPPVPKTRRVAPDGAIVEIDLTGQPFGAGPHACPGRLHALALADGLVQAKRATD
ncbi:hypothetical protein F1D05_25410 [Kribbella qitaiheensis]|uniref:Cytochrome P450 n=1 Tax=Kribbella qitaiheensis TaxID=1544730 RepID=A0A7G6X325_9ACTN|nr:hypothetical protein [Kribbella qitaiheensis]QNE20640.1 hypothetical protein F1D05_25410 [Kribbella qitaiheensis]